MSNLYSDINTFTPTKKSMLFDIESIYQSLMTLLDINLGELYFDKIDFGTSLENSLFELATSGTVSQILNDVINLIENNESRVSMDLGNTTIDVDMVNHRIAMKLVFNIVGLSNERFVLVKNFQE